MDADQSPDEALEVREVHGVNREQTGAGPIKTGCGHRAGPDLGDLEPNDPERARAREVDICAQVRQVKPVRRNRAAKPVTAKPVIVHSLAKPVTVHSLLQNDDISVNR